MSTMKIAVITGGSRGLGRNSAIHLAKRGVGSILTWRTNKAEADRVVQEIENLGATAVALPLDTGKPESFADFAGAVEAALRQSFGRQRFDYLLNNAGMGLRKPFAETTEAELDELYQVHLKGPFLLTQKLLPLLEDGGRILNVSTGLARFTLPGYSAYAAMKGGIEVLTRYMAKELGSRKISVNVIAPGAIETDFNGGVLRDNQEMNKMVASITALGRVGLPDDIGPVIANLFSDEMRWVNAQRIEASGGQAL